jgi:guanosine-3',5'-bis(diphosphate) 3'-pyrophosphohydrolase
MGKSSRRTQHGAGAVPLLLHALEFAADKHRKQLRKDAHGTPYVNHLIVAANLLVEVGGVRDPKLLAAAVLHDTIEDTETTQEELERHFGPEIAGLVAEVTDDKSLEREERKRLQIVHAPHVSPGASLIKIADKIANLIDILERPPVNWSLQRRLQYVDWAEQVVAGCRGRNAALDAHFDKVVRRLRKALKANY